MKVLVLGSEGMLGNEMVKHLKGFELIAPKREEYNAFESLDKFNLAEGDVVVNCIGAIPQKNFAYPVMQVLNTNFPHWLAAHEHLMIIQIATDCVFSGKTGSYDENYTRDAEDPYGLTKKLGEVIAPNFLNLRCSIIGQEVRGKKNLFEWVRNQPQNAQIYGYANHLWNGLTTRAFSQIVRGILEQEFFIIGTQHLVPADIVSKYELVKLIAKKTGREDIDIVPQIVEPINRTLDTIHPHLNRELWKAGGYETIPTIAELVETMEVE